MIKHVFFVVGISATNAFGSVNLGYIQGIERKADQALSTANAAQAAANQAQANANQALARAGQTNESSTNELNKQLPKVIHDITILCKYTRDMSEYLTSLERRIKECETQLWEKDIIIPNK